MSTENKQFGQELMKNALKQLIADRTAKINKNAVAKKAGLSHSLFRKSTYAKIAEDIEIAKTEREKELSERRIEQDLAAAISKLKSAQNKNQELTDQLNKPKPKDVKTIEGEMMARLVEMYRFNDLLRSELRQKNIDIVEETGEILKFQFNRDN